MKIKIKKYLQDIITSIESINSFINGDYNFIHYQNNKL
jgi:uncharacterized protein with HEPN domain